MILKDSEKEKIIAHFLKLPIAEVNELENNKDVVIEASGMEISEVAYSIFAGKIRAEWTHKENGYVESLITEAGRYDILSTISTDKTSENIIKIKRDFETFAMKSLVQSLRYLFKEKPDNISETAYALFEETIETILHPPIKEKKTTKSKLIQKEKDEFISLATAYIKARISENKFNSLEGKDDFEKVTNWLKERENKNKGATEEATNKMNLFG